MCIHIFRYCPCFGMLSVIDQTSAACGCRWCAFCFKIWPPPGKAARWARIAPTWSTSLGAAGRGKFAAVSLVCSVVLENSMPPTREGSSTRVKVNVTTRRFSALFFF